MRRISRAGEYSAYWIASVVVVAAWVVIHFIRPTPWFPLDDAYITIHSAQVLHWGFDPNFPGVAALYGATSAPFLALEYVLQFVLTPLYAAQTACWLGVLAYAAGLVYLARTLRLGRYETAAIVALGLASSFVPVHLLNGLETGFALAGVVWTLGLSSGERAHPRWAAFAGGCTAAIRPDLAPFAVFVIAAMTYESWRRERWAGRRVVTEFSLLIGLAFLPVLPFCLWYLRETGFPYPLTGVAKRYYFASGRLPAYRKLMPVALLGVFAVTCGPLVVGVLASWRSAIAKAIVAFMAVMGVIAFWELPDIFAFNLFRYTIVLVPMMVWGVAFWVSKTEKVDGRRGIVTICLIWCAMLFVPAGVARYVQACRMCDQGEHELVTWCQENLPSDAKLLVQDAGYVAYGSRFRVVDYVGLKTPEAIALNKEYTWASGGARRAEVIATLSRREGAEYLVVLSHDAPTNGLPRQLAALGWRAEALKTYGYYAVYRLHPPSDAASVYAAR